MMKKIVLLSIVSALYADITPEKLLGPDCLKGYYDRYQSKKNHKVFVYAKEEKTDKSRCTWSYGYDSIEAAKKESLKDCQKYHLNAECKVIDIDGKFVAKEGDFTSSKQNIDGYKTSIFKANLKKIKSYIIDGYDPNIQSDKDGITPLFVAAGKGDEELFFTLIEKGGDIKHKAKDKSTLLLAAAAGGNPTIIRYLLDKGFDVNAKGALGMTPLMGAFGNLHTYAASILLRHGADTSIKGEDGKNANDFAKKWKLDLESMKKIEAKEMDSEGFYPLFDAVKFGDVVMIEKLVKLGANPNKIERYGMSAFNMTDKDKIIKALIKVGADINHQDEDGKTALMSASEDSEIKKIKLLLANGADKSIKDKDKKSAYDLIKDQKDVSQEIKNLLK